MTLRAVMDAAAVERGAFLGWSEGGSYSAFFAAREPERVSHLILYAAPPRIVRTDDYAAGWPRRCSTKSSLIQRPVGEPTRSRDGSTQARAEDEAYRRWFGHMQRLAASPGSAREMMAGLRDLDIRDLLSVPPGTDAHPPSGGRDLGSGGAQSVSSRAHPGCQIPGVARRRPLAMDG